MRDYLRNHLGAKLFPSYLVVIIVGVVTVHCQSVYFSNSLQSDDCFAVDAWQERLFLFKSQPCLLPGGCPAFQHPQVGVTLIQQSGNCLFCHTRSQAIN